MKKTHTKKSFKAKMRGGEENIFSTQTQPTTGTMFETLKGHATNLANQATSLVNTNLNLKEKTNSLIQTLSGHATNLANKATGMVSGVNSNITGGKHTKKRNYKKHSYKKNGSKKKSITKRKFRKGTTKKRNFKK